MSVQRTVRISLSEEEVLKAIEDYLLVHKDTFVELSKNKPKIQFHDEICIGNFILEYNEEVN